MCERQRRLAAATFVSVRPVAAMVIGSPNARVNRFRKYPVNPRKMGISCMSLVARPLRRLRTVHPDI
jgi:hypothetical protein